MSGLAHICLDWGLTVSGTDAKASEALDCLAARGARVQAGHAADCVDGAELLVYSSAVREENPERIRARELGIPEMRRGEFLAHVATCFDNVVAVGGSHGKTTTAAMLAHILLDAGRQPGYLIGGDVPAWPRPARAGSGVVLVTEVDESDGTQSLVRSSHAIVTNVEDDHCWSLGGIEALERCFVDFADAAQRLITWDHPTPRRLFSHHPAARFLALADWPAGMELAVPGAHNLMNATLALEAAMQLGVAPAQAAVSLRSFCGVSRRLSERFRSPDGRIVIVEDYAHHPTELRASLSALRGGYPKHRLLAVFQAHRVERVKRYAAEFADALSTTDEAVVTAPFAAWLDDLSLADPRTIATAVRGVPSRYHDGPLAELAAELAAEIAGRPGNELAAVIGAGDVSQLVPLLRNCVVDGLLERWRHDLATAVGGLRIGRDQTWSELTTLRLGSGRPLVARPESTEQLVALLARARTLGLSVQVLGGGSNLVGTDDELPCLFVQLRQGEFVRTRRRGAEVRCGAGVPLARLIRGVLRAGHLPAVAAGLAWIPGTVGGAITMNAGAHDANIGDFVARVCGLRTSGEPWGQAGDEIDWRYRGTDIPGDVILADVTLTFPDGDATDAVARLEETGRRRRESQPRGHSVGCVFRNPPGQAAGRLLDSSGCKGLRVGGCGVSRKHANFLMHDSQGTEQDFVELVLEALRRVQRQTGLVLEPEVRFVNPATAARVRKNLDWLHDAAGPAREPTASAECAPSSERDAG
ncbi:MAG: hypothetical protein A3K19_29215 [Lentisphaerae bacterium RIFOXYB12_FULL_65_16]|nr:MAG: hypothetical protein A3K18_13430 [Lentisphaerae bacterium RIFOXYA12_64_32]OGV88384.1 MAG: hypothetical protein A3K19_29215 [Lentisphaerae bacterium RIFOXYB12_FULL_65_16]